MISIPTTLPCETCITRAICKYKPFISCSLLVKVYKDIKLCNNIFPDRVLEKYLADFFKWNYDFTMAIKGERVIIIKDNVCSRISR